MKKPTVIAILVLVALTLSVAVLLRRRPPEPSYEGKSLTQWLGQLAYSHSPQDLQASNAVYQMGTNVLRFLGPMLHAHDSKLKLMGVQLLSKQRLVKIRFLPADEHRMRASRACRVLGTNAIQYLPELTAMLDSNNRVVAWCGLVAIGDIKPGPQRWPELTKALSNNWPQVRWVAASHLGRAGEKAMPAVPALIGCLNDPDAEVRHHAIEALQQIKPEATLLVPLFVRCLDDRVPSVRQAAAIALGKFGTDAAAAKTRLAECEKDEHQLVRIAAADALKRIGGNDAN